MPLPVVIAKATNVPTAYEFPVIREMELEDGTRANVVVGKSSHTRDELLNIIKQAQAKLDAMDIADTK